MTPTNDKKPRKWWIDAHEQIVHQVGAPFYGGASGSEELPHILVREVLDDEPECPECVAHEALAKYEAMKSGE